MEHHFKCAHFSFSSLLVYFYLGFIFLLIILIFINNICVISFIEVVLIGQIAIQFILMNNDFLILLIFVGTDYSPSF